MACVRSPVTSSGIDGDEGGDDDDDDDSDDETEDDDEDAESALRAGATTADAHATASAAVDPLAARRAGDSCAQSQRWRSESWKRTVGGGGSVGGEMVVVVVSFS